MDNSVKEQFIIIEQVKEVNRTRTLSSSDAKTYQHQKMARHANSEHTNSNIRIADQEF